MKYGKHSPDRKFISSPFVLLGLLILVIILARAVRGINEKARISQMKLSQAGAELIKLEAKQDELLKQVEYLSTEKGIEAEFRDKYHGVREGESVAVIIDRDERAGSVPINVNDQEQLATVVEAGSTTPIGWWRRLLQLVGI